MAGITVKIGGVDKTEYVDARTLSIRDELTSKVNSASFDFICNDIAVAPKPGEAVLIEEGTKKLFSGRILSKEENFLPPNLLKYPVECVDHTRDLDKKLVAESYKNQKAGDIYKHIIDNYTTGFTYTNVSDGPTISEIAFDYVQVSEALTKIAEICDYEWYVDYDKDIHFFARSAYPAPFQLDDNQTDYKDLIINTDISQLRNRIFVKSSGLKDTFGEIFIYDGVATEWTCKFAPIYKERIKLPDINLYLILNQGAWNTDFSHDDIYLAIAYERFLGKGKGIILLKRTNDDFAKINDPDITPNADGHDVTFSSDSTYLAVVSDVSPYVMIYKRDEDTFTKVDDPEIKPTGTGWGCDFSPDGVYLAVAHATSPYITIYKRDGDVFTKLEDPVGGLPPDTGIGAEFSPSGDYLVVTHDTTPYITIYKRDGDVFTKLEDPVGGLPTGSGNMATWTLDSLYLAIGHNTSPYITVYKRADDVFTKIADPAEKPTGTCCGVDWSPDGINLAVAHENSPFVTIYIRTGDTLNKQDDPIDLPDGTAKGATYSHNGRYLVISCFARPQLTIYKQFSPTIKVDGVIKTIGWDGIDDPLYFDFMLNSGTKVLSIGAAGTSFIDIGSPAIEQEGSVLKEFTHIGKENPANASGKINKIEIWAYENLFNTIVATFTQVAENVFTARDSQYIGTVISGSKQTFSVDLEVAEGDFIGIYFTSGKCMMHFAGVGRWALYGDQSSCSEATFNFTADRTISLYGTGTPAEGELSIGSEILVGYATVGVPICFKREDQDSIDIIKALEGGDGIIEFCLVDNNIDSIAWANEAAKADLLKNANSAIRATFITNRSDIRSGQIITLSSTKRDINQQFIIQSVELVRVDVITEWPTIPYKPADEAVIGYKPASEAEIPYRAAGDSGNIIYYIFNVTIANKFKKLEDLFLHLLTRSEES